jgi:hypothetical protein
MGIISSVICLFGGNGTLSTLTGVCFRRSELFLPTAGHIDEGAFRHEPLRRRESKAAAAACYHYNFAL